MSRKSSMRILLQLFCLTALSLMLWGCGGSGGDDYAQPLNVDSSPVDGAATSVLIEPATLKTWIDQGLVGNEGGFGSNVVVVDFRSPAGSDRISGACRAEGGDLTAKRLEGVTEATPLVATGEQMDTLLQRLGINEKSIIIFTSGGNGYMPTRAYWSFRYWGFPKERLKLLNGGNAAFAAAYPGLMTQTVPTPTASDYSVKDLAGVNDDLRASIGEMIGLFAANLENSTTDIVFDARGPASYSGLAATSALVRGDVVVVDSTLR